MHLLHYILITNTLKRFIVARMSNILFFWAYPVFISEDVLFCSIWANFTIFRLLCTFSEVDWIWQSSGILNWLLVFSPILIFYSMSHKENLSQRHDHWFLGDGLKISNDALTENNVYNLKNDCQNRCITSRHTMLETLGTYSDKFNGKVQKKERKKSK